MAFKIPPLSYLQFFQGWNRLEARSRRDDFSLGLAARTADGYYMAGRAWQLGEVKGEDAGSAVHVRATYEEARLDRIQLGGNAAQALDETPVEVLVERE